MMKKCKYDTIATEEREGEEEAQSEGVREKRGRTEGKRDLKSRLNFSHFLNIHFAERRSVTKGILNFAFFATTGLFLEDSCSSPTLELAVSFEQALNGLRIETSMTATAPTRIGNSLRGMNFVAGSVNLRLLSLRCGSKGGAFCSSHFLLRSTLESKRSWLLPLSLQHSL